MNNPVREIWLDAQLFPGLARWLTTCLGCPTRAVRDLGLRDRYATEILGRNGEALRAWLTGDDGLLEIRG